MVRTCFAGPGLSSTIADYFRFLQMVLNGGELNGVRLLSPRTVNLMISNHIGDLSVSLRGPGYGFGLGYSILLDAGKSKEPLSPGSFGWGGAYCTYFFVDPTEELIGVFMTQMTPYRHINVRGQFAVLCSQAMIDAMSSGKNASVATSRCGKWVARLMWFRTIGAIKGSVDRRRLSYVCAQHPELSFQEKETSRRLATKTIPNTELQT